MNTHEQAQQARQDFIQNPSLLALCVFLRAWEQCSRSEQGTLLPNEEYGRAVKGVMHSLNIDDCTLFEQIEDQAMLRPNQRKYRSGRGDCLRYMSYGLVADNTEQVEAQIAEFSHLVASWGDGYGHQPYAEIQPLSEWTQEHLDELERLDAYALYYLTDQESYEGEQRLLTEWVVKDFQRALPVDEDETEKAFWQAYEKADCDAECQGYEAYQIYTQRPYSPTDFKTAFIEALGHELDEEDLDELDKAIKEHIR